MNAQKMILVLILVMGSTIRSGERRVPLTREDLPRVTRELLVQNPRKACEMARTVFLGFHKQIAIRRLIIDTHTAATEKYHQESQSLDGWISNQFVSAPVMRAQRSENEILDESRNLCSYFGLLDGLKSGRGTLSWLTQPVAMQWFTKAIVDAVDAKVSRDGDAPIQLVSVSAGRGVMDAVILATILQKHPRINLTLVHGNDMAYQTQKADVATNKRLVRQFKEWFAQNYPDNKTVTFRNACADNNGWSAVVPDIVYARDNQPMLSGEVGQLYDMLCKKCEQQGTAFAGMMIGLSLAAVESYGRGELTSLTFDSQAPHRVDVLPPMAPAQKEEHK